MKNIRALLVIVLLAAVIMIVPGCGTPSASVPSVSGSPAAKTITPVKLAFLTQPGGASAGSPLNYQPVVAVQDSDGNTVAGTAFQVSLAITSGSGSEGAASLRAGCAYYRQRGG